MYVMLFNMRSIPENFHETFVSYTALLHVFGSYLNYLFQFLFKLLSFKLSFLCEQNHSFTFYIGAHKIDTNFNFIFVKPKLKL